MYIISYVCTRAKVFGFAMNPGCFYISDKLTLELFNPEKFAGTSYPKKYESGEKTLV